MLTDPVSLRFQLIKQGKIWYNCLSYIGCLFSAVSALIISVFQLNTSLRSAGCPGLLVRPWIHQMYPFRIILSLQVELNDSQVSQLISGNSKDSSYFPENF